MGLGRRAIHETEPCLGVGPEHVEPSLQRNQQQEGAAVTNEPHRLQSDDKRDAGEKQQRPAERARRSRRTSSREAASAAGGMA